MKEQNIKPSDLKVGDILLFPPTGWIGKVIATLSKGSVSHAAVYCGNSRVAHSDMPGIIYEPLDKCLEGEKGAYIRRLDSNDMKPLLAIIDKYTDKGIKYPFAELILLGMLLLTKRFTNEILNHPILYKLIKNLVSKLVEKREALSMTCSQFVAQCYEEAGLKIEYKEDTILENSSNGDGFTLAEIIRKEEYKDLTIGDELITDNAENLDDLCIGFIELLEQKTALSGCQAEKDDQVEEKDLVQISNRLALELCEIITDKKVGLGQDAVDALFKVEPFFIAPEDLLQALNLDDVGFLNPTTGLLGRYVAKICRFIRKLWPKKA